MGSIRLVRHAQASFGADDYDVLSLRGHKQAEILRKHWATPSLPRSLWAATGTLRRQMNTARTALHSLNVVEDERWNEFDEASLLSWLPPKRHDLSTQQFQVRLNLALSEWIAKGADSHGESFIGFQDRVLAGFEDATTQAGSGSVATIFSSAGPIALVASHLLSGDASLFLRLNDVLINASITTVIVGRTGPRLLTFNDHGHLPKSHVTFR
ncbi:histidine phosphatase family protein [Janibacter cremeus]|uniref:Broad specificity phosphatase PhoE n=1 Tax=Janibacter cremeus TaxID=1285192 RepID=A0A852VPL5_9MICO|nr:histidine phosphatase family protein [Janibacter cremeus]NYF97668.1 broad specificity phosphatase PhoE [Janibacter cremeus]